ncbi:hypothetical protein EV361DRAFT_485156 [Lentinula raphanica]|nr:hypothetical protein EV361DRAFT_485156 [Lentinula raphanica]
MRSSSRDRMSIYPRTPLTRRSSMCRSCVIQCSHWVPKCSIPGSFRLLSFPPSFQSSWQEPIATHTPSQVTGSKTQTLGQAETPICPPCCQNDNETVRHYLMECPAHRRAREKLQWELANQQWGLGPYAYLEESIIRIVQIHQHDGEIQTHLRRAARTKRGRGRVGNTETKNNIDTLWTHSTNITPYRHI